jgi:hypothetical protein
MLGHAYRRNPNGGGDFVLSPQALAMAIIALVMKPGAAALLGALGRAA